MSKERNTGRKFKAKRPKTTARRQHDEERLREAMKVFNEEVERITDSRDRIRDALSDIEAILDSTNSGLEQLRGAINTLSKYL